MAVSEERDHSPWRHGREEQGRLNGEKTPPPRPRQGVIAPGGEAYEVGVSRKGGVRGLRTRGERQVGREGS